MDSNNNNNNNNNINNKQQAVYQVIEVALPLDAYCYWGT